MKSKILEALIKPPKASNQDLSTTVDSSMAPGYIYPVLMMDCLPGDKFSIDVEALAETMPTVGNFKGSYDLEISFFWCPWSHYLVDYQTNEHGFFSEQRMETALPWIEYPRMEADYEYKGAEFANAMKFRVAPSSLAEFAGVPQEYAEVFVEGTTSPKIRHNILGQICYYDVLRQFYANVQEGVIPIKTGVVRDAGSSVVNASSIYTFDISGFDKWFNNLLSVDSFVDTSWLGEAAYLLTGSGIEQKHLVAAIVRWFTGYGASVSGKGDGLEDIAPVPQCGLGLHTFRSDWLTNWIDYAEYDKVNDSAKVLTDQGYFKINTLRFQNRTQEFFEKAVLAGGRITDFILAEWGVKCGQDLNRPDYLGTSIVPITFNEVINQAGDINDTAYKSFLGGRVAFGNAKSSTPRKRFSCDMYGTLLCMASIIPHVKYSTGLSPFRRKTKLADIYHPTYDAIGFQPITRADFQPYPEYVLNSNTEGVNSFAPSRTEAVADINWQERELFRTPAWIEYTTNTDRTTGNLASAGNLSFWRNNRTFHFEETKDIAGILSITSTFSPTTYVYPDRYNNVFAAQGENDENFNCRFKFNILCRRRIGKHIMPSL